MSDSPLGNEHRDEPLLLLVGTDHRCAPVNLREQVSLSAEESEEMMVHLLARDSIAETVILSTCNRTEVYLCPRDEETAYRECLDLVFRRRAPELDEPGRLYVHRGRAAAEHLLAVASGLESMVLGEPEILGQVRQAASLAHSVGARGLVLEHLLRRAMAAGKRARSETEIGAGAVSLGYATVELARNIFTGLEDIRVLLVGAGEIARSTARALVDRGVRRLIVANRTRSRAEEMIELFPDVEVEVVPFEERHAATARVELAVVSTSADEPVLIAPELGTARRRSKGRPLLVVDLSVPRNVDAGARRVPNLFLHDIDSLQALIERNLKRRREEVPQVQEIVAAERDRFYRWYRSLAVEPLVANLQRQADEVRRRELARVLPGFPEEYHEELDRFTRSLVRKILHHPSTRLRQQQGEEALPRLDLVRELFRLEDGDD